METANQSNDDERQFRTLLVALIDNVLRQTVVKEFGTMPDLEDVYQKDLAEWAFKELQLTTLPSQPTILTIVQETITCL